MRSVITCERDFTVVKKISVQGKKMIEQAERTYSQAVENYLKAIYKLQSREGAVSTNELSRKIRTTPAAVTKMIKHLSELDLAKHTPYYGVRLTESGEKVALEVIRHHRLLELYLHRTLGYRWDEVDAEAEKLEHYISEEFEARIDKLLDFPILDPHGDPIPTRDGRIAAVRGHSLSEAKTGDLLIVRRVCDENSEALRCLAQIGIALDTVIQLVERQTFDQSLTLLVNGEKRIVGRELAKFVFVERQEEAGSF